MPHFQLSLQALSNEADAPVESATVKHEREERARSKLAALREAEARKREQQEADDARRKQDQQPTPVPAAPAAPAVKRVVVTAPSEEVSKPVEDVKVFDGWGLE